MLPPVNGENPTTHKQESLCQEFKSLIDALKGLIPALGIGQEKVKEEGQKQPETLTEIGPLRIDETSITKLTEALQSTLTAQFASLIEALNENQTEQGTAETTVSGRLDHAHKMDVNVSGKVEAPESMKNLSQQINKIVMDILRKQPGFSGADLASGQSPTNNAEGGTR